MQRLRHAEHPEMAARKGARPTSDERADIAEHLTEEQESFPQLTLAEIEARVQDLRHERARLWAEFLEGHDEHRESIDHTLPMKERLERYFTRGATEAALMRTLESENLAERLSHYVEFLQAIYSDGELPLVEFEHMQVTARLLSVLQKDQSQEAVRAVCEEIIREYSETALQKQLAHLADNARISRATTTDVTRQSNVELFHAARHLKGEDRTKALTALLGSHIAVSHILQDAYGQSPDKDATLEALKASGELQALFESVAPWVVLHNPNLFEVTLEMFTRIEMEQSMPLREFADSMYRQSGYEVAWKQWAEWMASLPDKTFQDTILLQSESLFVWNSANDRPAERQFIADAYRAIARRMADMIERDMLGVDPKKRQEQWQNIDFANVRQTFPELSNDLALQVGLELGLRGHRVGLNKILPVTLLHTHEAVNGEAGRLFVERCLEMGREAELLGVLADRFTVVMGNISVGERLDLLERLYQRWEGRVSQAKLRRVMIMAHEGGTFRGAKGVALMRRFVEGTIEESPEEMLESEGLFEMASREQRREIVEKFAKEDPYFLVRYWKNTKWVEPFEGIKTLEALKERGIEPFSFVKDMELLDKMLRMGWYEPPDELVFHHGRNGQSQEHVERETNLSRSLLQQSERWLTAKSAVEREVVFARLDDIYSVQFTKRPGRSELPDVMRAIDNDTYEMNVMVRAIEAAIGEQPTPEQEPDIHLFTRLVAGSAEAFFSRQEAAKTFLKRAREPNPFDEWKAGTMLSKWLTDRFCLSEKMLSAWLEVGHDSDIRPEINFAKHISTLRELESERPTSAATLEKEFGVRAFGRYSPEMLLRQVRERNDTEKPYGVLVMARGDHNGALFNARPLEAFRGLEHHLTRIIEVESLREAARRFLQMERRGYPKASFMLIGGHGTPDAVQLGIASNYDAQGMSESGQQFDTRHLKGRGVERFGERFLQPDAPVIFDSCSTGVEGGISENASRVWGLEMIAPAMPCFVNAIELKETEQGVKVVRVEYQTSMPAKQDSPIARRYTDGRLRGVV